VIDFIKFFKHMIIDKLTLIQNEIQSKVKNLELDKKNREIIAVSKTFPISRILPLIDHGHLHFGENKVQEAVEKWEDIKLNNNKIKLHMIGNLQRNKVKDALQIFDYIHSLDNLKLAKKISEEQKKLKKTVKLFIQVNIGYEVQKSGILPDDVNDFFNSCSKDLNLDIIGLMCLPPQDIDPENYFSQLNLLNTKIGLNELSMGMSSDYLKSLKYGSTFLRIGSKIFGKRD